jgi:hypothetical protein
MMEPGTKYHFYIDGVFENTYFLYKNCTNSSSYDDEYHEPRVVGGVIVHYTPAEVETEAEV